MTSASIATCSSFVRPRSSSSPSAAASARRSMQKSRATRTLRSAGLVSVVFDRRFTAQQVDAFVDALRLFRIGWSWGGPVSLAVPYDTRAIRDGKSPYEGMLVRFCLGLESVDDLVADATQALGVLAG